jgi:hypothetical protein
LPYFCTKLCSTSESLSARSIAAASSPRVRSEYAQPTWLHSSNIWLQTHAHELMSQLVEAGIDISAHERNGQQRDEQKLGTANKFGVSDSEFQVVHLPIFQSLSAKIQLCCRHLFTDHKPIGH